MHRWPFAAIVSLVVVSLCGCLTPAIGGGDPAELTSLPGGDDGEQPLVVRGQSGNTLPTLDPRSQPYNTRPPAYPGYQAIPNYGPPVTPPGYSSGPAPVDTPYAGQPSTNPAPTTPATPYAPRTAPPAGSYTTPPNNTYTPPPTGGYAPPNNSYTPPPNGYYARPPAAGGTAPPPGAVQPYASPQPGVPPPTNLPMPGTLDYNGAMQDPEVDIVTIVEEAPTGRLMFGVGLNSDAGVLGSVVIDEQNFDWRRFPRSFDDIRNATAWRGAGQQFRLEAVPGDRVQRYLFSFREPYLFDSRVSFGLSGFFFTRRFEDWDEERLGGRVSLGYQFPNRPDLSTTLSLRAENVNINDILMPAPSDLTDVLGDNDIYSAKIQLTHDTRDSAFLPTEGHLFEIAYEQAFGEFNFPKGTIDYRRYFLLRQRLDGSGRHVLSFRGRAGVTGDNTPIFERFFAGGTSTLRGFDFRGASPVIGSVTVGGQLQLLGSVEYMFPVTADDMLRLVFFTDFGTVEEDIEIDSDDFRVAPGFGLRVTIPAMGPAPLAFDFAFPIASEVTDDEQVFSFSVGFQN